MKLGRETFGRGLARLLLELIIVFAGVYLAFLFNGYQASRQRAVRRAQLRAALASEIDVFSQSADRFAPILDSLQARWDSAYTAGACPEPLAVPSGGVDMPPRGIWQAVLASDPLSTLDVATMQSVSSFYNALDVLIEKYNRLRTFYEASIIPHSDDSAGGYCRRGSTVLRPEYRAYMNRFRDFLNLFKELQGAAADSRKKLDGSSLP
jgi:hypothetical protein